MRVYLGSDHAGFALKGVIAERLRALGYETIDVGPHALDPEDDYPPYCLKTAASTVADPGSLGIVVGGSGNGEAIAANKVRGARCAIAHSEETAKLAREHNDANLLSLGARMISEEEALRFVEIFVSTAFSGGARHVRRIGEIADYERSGVVPDPR